MAAHPAHPQAGQAKRFGQDAKGYGPGIEVAGRRQGGNARGFRETVDLVGKDPYAMLRSRGDDGRKRFRSGQVAGGIVGKIDRQDLGRGT